MNHGNHPKTGTRERGSSLVETLIALTLALFILTSVGYVYIAQRTSERGRGAVAGMQDGARFGLEALRRDLLQAGYVGCNSNLQRAVDKATTETVVIPMSSLVTIPGVTDFTVNAATAVRVFDASAAAGTWGGSVPTGAVAGTHVIEVRYATPDGASYLNAAIPAAGTTLTTVTQVNLGIGDDAVTSSNRMALLSDCASGMVVSVASVAATTVNVDATLPVTSVRCQHASRVGASCFYWPATMLMPIRLVQYYVAETTTAGVTKRGLWMRKRAMATNGWSWNAPVQLADGLNSLRVFGVGLDVAAPADPAWVVSREVTEAANGTNAVENLSAAEWGRVLRMDVRVAMRSEGTADATNGKAVYRNFETSYAVRSRAVADM